MARARDRRHPATAGPRCSSSATSRSPTPGAGELLVAVEAIGVNYRDVYEREGRGAATGARRAAIVGRRGRGHGAAAARAEFATGDRVGWAARRGTYAEQVAGRRATRPCACPTASSSELAAAAMLQGMTAHYLRDSHLPDPGAATSCSCTPPPAASGCC